MPSDHLTTEPAALVDFKLHVDTSRLRRQVWRYERMFRAMLREGRGFTPSVWLDDDPPTFAFPAWGPAWRPFDWAVDS